MNRSSSHRFIASGSFMLAGALTIAGALSTQVFACAGSRIPLGYGDKRPALALSDPRRSERNKAHWQQKITSFQPSRVRGIGSRARRRGKVSARHKG